MGIMDFLFGDPGTGAARAKEAGELFKGLGAFGDMQYGRSMGRLDKRSQQAMGQQMASQAAAANAAREAQEKAMALVAANSGNSELAAANAMSQFGGTGPLSQLYAQGGAQRSGLVMQRAGMEQGIEGLLAQIQQASAGGQANVLGAIDDSSQGIAGPALQAWATFQGLSA